MPRSTVCGQAPTSVDSMLKEEEEEGHGEEALEMQGWEAELVHSQDLQNRINCKLNFTMVI